MNILDLFFFILLLLPCLTLINYEENILEKTKEKKASLRKSIKYL